MGVMGRGGRHKLYCSADIIGEKYFNHRSLLRSFGNGAYMRFEFADDVV